VISLVGFFYFSNSASAAYLEPRRCTTGLITGPPVPATYSGPVRCYDDSRSNYSAYGYVYKGGFQNGQFEGKGTYKCITTEGAGGDQYKGNFVGGRAKGQGRLRGQLRFDWDLGQAEICTITVAATDEGAICEQQNEENCKGSAGKGCFWWGTQSKCASRSDSKICFRLPEQLCGPITDGSTPGSLVCKWNKDTKKCNSPLQAGLSSGVDFSKEGAFPNCGHDGTCDSVNDLLQQQVGYINWIMGFIGVIGFISFIAGGLMMITSFGNPEKFKSGTKLMVGAIIGLVIAFSAYILVDFILDALGVDNTFRGIL
jgi:hypothetical protein